MAEDIESENLIVKKEDDEDRAVLAEIEFDAKDVSPQEHDTRDAGIRQKRFDFMVLVGSKEKRRS